MIIIIIINPTVFFFLKNWPEMGCEKLTNPNQFILLVGQFLHKSILGYFAKRVPWYARRGQKNQKNESQKALNHVLTF